MSDPAGLPFPELQAQITGLYYCDHHQPQNLAGVIPDAIEILLEAMVRKVFNNGMPGTVDKKMVLYYANELWNGIVDGFGSDIDDVDFDTPDYNMLRHLQENVFQFSAAKNYQQLKALSEAVKDGDRVRTFEEFRTIAQAINNEQVNQWLKAEYDMAIGSSQSARMWNDFEANKEALPLLEFDAIIDGRTTEICRTLNGVVRPVDDHFWDIYYIPNHWGERSTIRATSGKAVTPMSEVVTPEKMPDIFKTNLAKKKLAFPPGHPYYIGLPEQVKEQAAQILKDAREQ